MSGAALAQAARGLVGARYRLHGRDPATGLDCIGVLAAALAASGCTSILPRAYSLRSRTVPDLEPIARSCGFSAVESAVAPGDVLMVRCSPCQFHLLIAAGGERFVHAHAGLKRVILGRMPVEWSLIGRWRTTDAH